MASAPKTDYRDDPSIWQIRRRLAAGIGLVALLAASVGGWAATARLSGYVIAQGLIVVESNIKKVQHPSGGVVGAVFVKNGDRASAPDGGVGLGGHQTRANLCNIVSPRSPFTDPEE